MRRVAVAAAVTLASFSQTLGIEDAALLACTPLQDGAARLQCFDALAATVTPKADQTTELTPAASAQSSGNWRVTRTKNPLDDTETVVASLIASEGVSRYGDPVSFVARCQSNTTEAYIVWNDYLGDDGGIYDEYKRVIIRVGETEASTERWGISTDSKATFAPSWAGDLLKRMLSANRMVAQTTPYNESPQTAVFDTTGMRAAIEPLAKVCQWDLPADG